MTETKGKRMTADEIRAFRENYVAGSAWVEANRNDPDCAHYVELHTWATAVLDHFAALEAEIATLRGERDQVVGERDKWRGAYNNSLYRLEQAEAKAAALTRPPSDEEVAKTLLHKLRTYYGDDLEARSLLIAAAREIEGLSHQLSEARGKAFAEGAREGWMRALVAYVDMDAEGDPEYIAAMDRRFPLPATPEKPGATGS